MIFLPSSSTARPSTRKPGSSRGQLVEDAAGLAEVERVEVVAVDEARVGQPRRRCARSTPAARRRRCPTRRGARCRRSGARARRAPGRRRSSRRAGRRAARSGPRRRGGAHQRSSSAAEPAGLGAVGAHALEPAQRVLRRDLRVAGVSGGSPSCRPRARGPAPRGRRSARCPRRARPRCPRPQPVGPERERLRRADAMDDPVDHPGARTAGLREGVLEERQVRARMRLLVAVEEVVDAGIVLVDRLGDEPQPEDARVEVDVAPRVPGDGADVVDALELHPRKATPA